VKFRVGQYLRYWGDPLPASV